MTFLYVSFSLFQNGADFFWWGVDFFQNGVDFLKNLADFLKKVGAVFQCGADFWDLVAPVAFSVAHSLEENAPVSYLISADYKRQ